MIGGYDLIFDIEIDQELALHLVYDATSRRWPECVVVDSEHNKPLSRDMFSNQLAEAKTTEIMIFKDQSSRELWRKKGAVRQTEDTMVYALVGDRKLTLAVCNPNRGDVKEIVTAVKELVKDPIFHESHAVGAH